MSDAAGVDALLIRGGEVFHGDPPEVLEGALLLDGAVVGGEPDRTFERVKVLDADGCIVLPGFVIAHHHLYSALARGMPGPPSAPQGFVEVLEKIWWRLDRALDGDLVEVSALVGAVDALKNGVTGIVDHHASPSFIDTSLDRMASGVLRAGARAALCYEATDRHGDAAFEAGLAENARFAERDEHSLLRPMVGGHAPFTLSDPHLAELAALAKRHDIALHLHVAEGAHDQCDARERGAENVTSRLTQSGVLDGRAVIAHGVHLSEDEVAQLAASGAWLTHQPRSNMNNHVGYLGRARSLGTKLALGTDGINGDILGEAQTAFFRLREHDPQAAAETIWSWLAGGWRLLSESFGLSPERGFGWLHPGCPGDVVVFDYDSPTPVHAGNLPWHLAFGLGARHVRHVVVGGRLVVENGVATSIDERELHAESAAAAERLWQRMAEAD
jgi:putative selenium metabolism protein SsnA